MNKFHDSMISNIKVSVYPYAPESLKLTYKEEDVTWLLKGDFKYAFAMRYLNGDIKYCKDTLKRGIRKYSKFSNRPKLFKLCLDLNDSEYLSSSNYRLSNRFGNLEERVQEYKELKEYLRVGNIKKATLGNNFDIEKVESVSCFDNNFIKGIFYI